MHLINVEKIRQVKHLNQYMKNGKVNAQIVANILDKIPSWLIYFNFSLETLALDWQNSHKLTR